MWNPHKLIALPRLGAPHRRYRVDVDAGGKRHRATIGVDPFLQFGRAEVRDVKALPFIELNFIPSPTLKTAGTHRNPTERQNEKTRQKAGFSVVSEILKAFSGTLSGSTTWTRTRDPVINSHLLYQLSYRGMRRILLIKKNKSTKN
jgi:hypothetical protein